MNGQWFTIDDPSELQCGDIFETPSKIPPNSPICPGMLVGAVKHVGMVLIDEGSTEILIAHNPFGGYPEIKPYEVVFSDRKIERIKRTGVSSQQIRKRIDEIKDRPYSFWGWNCEMATRYLCGCSTGIDQRNAYAIVLLFLLILIILLLILKR